MTASSSFETLQSLKYCKFRTSLYFSSNEIITSYKSLGLLQMSESIRTFRRGPREQSLRSKKYIYAPELFLTSDRLTNNPTYHFLLIQFRNFINSIELSVQSSFLETLSSKYVSVFILFNMHFFLLFITSSNQFILFSFSIYKCFLCAIFLFFQLTVMECECAMCLIY